MEIKLCSIVPSFILLFTSFKTKLPFRFTKKNRYNQLFDISLVGEKTKKLNFRCARSLKSICFGSPSLSMDQSKNFLHNVATFAGQLNLSQLERSAMAYKRLCLELDTITNTPGPVATAPPPAPVASQGLRASASEFVPQVPLIGDRRVVDLGEEQGDYSDEIDDGYNEERNMRAVSSCMYNLTN